MGWSSFHLTEPVKDWFINGINNKDYEVLDVAIVKRKTLYAAVRVKATGEVYCAVYLLSFTRGYDNFAYKSMDESVCPYAYDCPERIFNRLTPLNSNDEANKYALQWRETVKEHHAKRKSLLGDRIIHIPEGVALNNGKTVHYFHKYGKKLYAGIMINGKFDPYFQVRNFSLMKYNVEILR